ncbi:MAG: 4Fe-4S dicluster domain-containing protein [Dehalococcoidia bacterium]|nr:4Fe-4S dicluster domain-containing protein [Dehalococcoidia bacterium]
MKLGRRDFLKYTIGAGGLALLGKYALFSRNSTSAQASYGVGEEPTRKPPRKEIADGVDTVVDTNNKFAMVIDVGACIGCRMCQWNCKAENNIPDAIYPPWIEVFQMENETDMASHPSTEELKQRTSTSYEKSPLEGKWYLPVQCQHCDNPPCVKVCPVGATYKDKDGLVLMNYDRCIGCRICIVACPYSARRFNWLEPELEDGKANPLVPVRPMSVVEKCTFCVHRTRNGKLPRCVEVCPVGARHFGNIKDTNSEVYKLLKSSRSYHLLEEANTKPSIYYITRGKKWPQS